MWYVLSTRIHRYGDVLAVLPLQGSVANPEGVAVIQPRAGTALGSRAPVSPVRNGGLDREADVGATGSTRHSICLPDPPIPPFLAASSPDQVRGRLFAAASEDRDRCEQRGTAIGLPT